jgi:hypothetical protein
VNYPVPPGQQYGQQPGYPQQPAQPGYAPQGQPQGYFPPAPQGYAPPNPYPQQYAPQPQFAPPAPAPVLARGTLEDYLDQPSVGGGQSVTKYFKGRPQNSWIQFRVTRHLTNSDVRQQTDNDDRPATYKDGKPKFVLVIQVEVFASDSGYHTQIFEAGEGSLWLKGITSDALKSAMSQAGIPNPDATLKSGKIGGSVITMVSAGEKQPNNPKYSATKLYNFTYVPGGEENAGGVAPNGQVPVSVQAPPQLPEPTSQPLPPAPVMQSAPQPPPQQIFQQPAFQPPEPPPGYPQQAMQAAQQGYPQPTPPPPGPGGVLPDPSVQYAQGGPVPPPAPGTAPGGTQYILPDGTPIDAEKLALLQKLNGGG